MIKKTVLLKVFTTQIRSAQIFSDPIQKRAPARSVRLEAVYLQSLLYIQIKFFAISIFATVENLGSVHET